MEIWDTSTEAVIEALRSRGWCFGNIQEVTAIIAINSALIDDKDPRKVADSTESELLNTDLKSIGGKSLPDPTRKFSHIQGPIVLQAISSSLLNFAYSFLFGFQCLFLLEGGGGGGIKFYILFILAGLF